MKKNKLILTIGGTVIFTGSLGYLGYELSSKKENENNKSANQATNNNESKKIAYANKVSDIVVTEITEDGYVTLHGDHSHFNKGLVPYNAKILDKLVLKDENYKLKYEDIQYELAEGYIIKVNGKFYYYPKENVTQKNIVDEKTAIEISKNSEHSHHDHHHHEGEDNYTFNPKDIVSETADSYIVRHGDHYHVIKKSSLSSNELAKVQAENINISPNNSTVGITTATSDGYIFSGEQDIISRNNLGLVVKHGNHEHFIFYSQLEGTKWQYLIPKNYVNAPTINNLTNTINNNDDDHYTFNPRDIVAEDGNGNYIVRHGDHFHIIPKQKNKIEDVLPKLPNIKPNESNNFKPSTPKIEDTVKTRLLTFSGIDFKTSDGFILSNNDSIIKTTAGLIVKHENHEHFLFYYQLINSSWQHLIPADNFSSAKKQYENLEQNVKRKIAILAKQLNTYENEFSFVVTDKGEAIKYQDKIFLLKDVEEIANNEQSDIDIKLTYVAKELGVDKSVLKIIDTKDGKAVIFPHGDHSHTVLIKNIDITKPFGKKHHHDGHSDTDEHHHDGHDDNDEHHHDGHDDNDEHHHDGHSDNNEHHHDGHDDNDEHHHDGHSDNDEHQHDGHSDNDEHHHDGHSDNDEHHHDGHDDNDEHSGKESNDNNSENNDEINKKINYLAKELGINKDNIQVIDTEQGKALIYPHGDHSHSILLKNIDTSKPLADPHANEGAETLEKLGFDADIIHDLQHAVADSPFPEHETDVEKMKEWLTTVRSLNIGQNKDPLKRKGLDLLPNVEILGIGFTPIDDITPVYQFKKLKQLYVTKTGIKDYSFIKNIPTLEGIDLSQNDITDISFLKNYPNLKVVAAAGNNITNIDSLKNLPNLESLNLDYNNISDISTLSKLENLKAVSLEHNNIKDLSALSNKKELTRLFISDNKELNLNSLKNSSLEELTVNNSNLDSLSFLENLPNLLTLTANDNILNSLAGVDKAKSLTTLTVNDNRISAFNTTSNSLQSLEIKNNRLVSLAGIDSFTTLENLQAESNLLNSFLAKKQNSLINLNVNNNFITLLNEINNFTTLKYLEASNNFINSLELDKPNTTVEYLDVSKNNIPQDELSIPENKQIPQGIAKNFTKVEGGSINNNYTLDKNTVDEKIKNLEKETINTHILEEINDIKNDLKNNSYSTLAMQKAIKLLDIIADQIKEAHNEEANNTYHNHSEHSHSEKDDEHSHSDHSHSEDANKHSHSDHSHSEDANEHSHSDHSHSEDANEHINNEQ